MNWLITGGCGFIGRALISRLLSEGGHSIRVLDNLTVGSRRDLSAVAPFIELTSGDSGLSEWPTGLALVVGDVLNENDVVASVDGANVVVHLAANTGVGPSVADPKSDGRTNIFGTLNVLEACRNPNSPRFVFASSGAPLGVQTPPLHEEMAPHPASPYGASKLAGEGYCSAYFHCFGIETVGLRFGNVYGQGSGHKQSLVAKFIKLALAGEQLEIYGNGSQTRDFIHISDLVDAILRASTVSGIGGEIFQIATASETSVIELTEKLLTAMNEEGISKPTTYHSPKRDGDVMRNYSDTSKAREKLGWVANVDLVEGLQQTIKYFIDAQSDTMQSDKEVI